MTVVLPVAMVTFLFLGMMPVFLVMVHVYLLLITYHYRGKL